MFSLCIKILDTNNEIISGHTGINCCVSKIKLQIMV
jgi:hypothetical protein